MSGYSPRMRLDISLNALCYQALKHKKIKVFGGKQIRPNIHIEDMINVYIFFIKKNKFKYSIYNASFENISILKMAKLIKKQINCSINIMSSNNDPRSYRQDSSRLINEGFKTKFSIKDSINDILNKYKNKTLNDDLSCYTTVG